MDRDSAADLPWKLHYDLFFSEPSDDAIAEVIGRSQKIV